MSFLFTSRDLVLQKEAGASQTTILELIQDPVKLCTLSPLVIGVEVDKDDPMVVYVTEKLVLLGFFKTTTKFTCKVKVLPGGVVADVTADLGTRLINHMWVEKNTDGTTVINEHTKVEALFFFMPFVYSTMSEAHNAVMDKLAAMS
ncbi:hypothetical protein CC2G_001085 [Coprinopsis cinerea AmutBmut pab1-1]|nr:hypothetical protein CC2G_001085 [Coprinopsis cinerea AmutBmut pab1-1]